MKIRSNSGFTLVEILIAIALGLVILAGLFQTFRTQHDTYIVQDQVAAMQQNLRAAMYLITRDLQMAGWYTNFDRDSNREIDLGSEDLGTLEGRPLFFGVNNYLGGDNVMRDGTDAIVIVKAGIQPGSDPRTLPMGESASGTDISSIDLAASDLETPNKRFGLLVKNDLRTADFFELDNATSLKSPLSETYTSGDLVFRADIIVYKIVEEGGRPMLKRKNLGVVDQYHTVAENIENMQVRYQLNDGSWENTLTPTNQALVRAVEVTLVGRTAHPQRGYTDTNTYTFTNDPDADYTPTGDDARFRRKALSTTVKTRNVGL
jgi:prepilin-type N-terminal cleavage/methylation domain-containing protein